MTLLIKGVQVLGADRDLPDRVHVFVSGDKISAIGNFPEKKADRVIDGQGAYLAPGFIDVNTDSDHYLSLFDNPSQDDFLRQGVTTIVGGHCGASLAPLLYGGLESIQKWTDVSKFNVDWHTVHEFLSIFESRKPLGVNFVTLIGHSTVRRAMIGEVLRDLTKNELIVFGETLKRGFREGAAGFSTGLGYVHSRGTPYSEIKYLAKIASDYRSVYSTHLRKSGAELHESIEETVKICEETGARVLINHLIPLVGFEAEYERALDRIAQLPKDWDFHFDIYPFETTVMPLYTFLPVWVQNGGVDVMLSNIEDEWLQPRIAKDIEKIDPHKFVVGRAVGNDALVGRSLREIMDFYSLGDPREALLKLMTTTKLRASIFYKNINPKLIKKGLIHPRSFVASNAASLSEKRKTEKLDRATSTFPKFLDMVQKENLMPLHDAIKKITKEPARKFNLRNRGEIKEGNFADLTCFREGEIKFTVVNGQLAFEDGESKGVLAGRALRHHGY